MAEKRCTRCGTDYTAEEVASGQAFEPAGGKVPKDACGGTKWRSICRPCVEELRDLRKGVDRMTSKVSDVIRRHAVRLSNPRAKNGVIAWYDPELTGTKLELVYGWNRRQMRHDFEFDYGNGCDYCHHPYKAMGHGPADMTLDIYDPTLAPDYSNTRRCCQTCQRRKGLLTPGGWAIKQRVYRKWEQSRAAVPQDRGFLF